MAHATDEATGLIHHPSGNLGGLAPGFDPSVTFPADEKGCDQEYIYGRTCHPTGDACAEALASLEGAEWCLLTNSGMAAISTVLLALLRSGDHVIAPNVMYQPTRCLLGKLLTNLGVSVSFVDARDPEAYFRALTPATRVAWLETPANPTLDLTDIAAVCGWAKANGVLTVADNTFSTPLGSRPISFGCDVVVHSATKYLAGHGDLLAGAILTSRALKSRILPWLDHLGSALHAHGAWLLRRGLSTFHLRYRRHQENALAVALDLQNVASVRSVLYPGLPGFPQRELFERQMQGAGGVLSFVLEGGEEQARNFLPNLRLCAIARSLGEPCTLIAHPWSMHYNALSDEEKQAAGIDPGLIRVAVGLEEPFHIVEDLASAISRSR
ncbi:MAG TPA: aminotransferase class I/II-fold pyridoxal phosphate-dependent enzyme [Fimbriimonas sp.]|nr:aminotransferase class I/II-fold pyridoxal phosphate-dependent enzyme [Fimbriimonas sp.]